MVDHELHSQKASVHEEAAWSVSSAEVISIFSSRDERGFYSEDLVRGMLGSLADIEGSGMSSTTINSIDEENIYIGAYWRHSTDKTSIGNVEDTGRRVCVFEHAEAGVPVLLYCAVFRYSSKSLIC